MQQFIVKLRNNVLSPYFLISVIAMLCMCTLARVPSWSMNGDPSILECTLSYDVQLWQSSRAYSSYEMFKAYDNFDWFPILLPLVAGFTSVSYLFEEQNSNYIRYVSMRSTKSKNVLVSMCSSGVSGGLAVVIGVLLFGVLVYCIYPNVESYTYPLKEGDITLYYLYPDQSILKNRVYFLVVKLVFLFLTAYLNACFTYLCLVIFRNKFIALTVPIVVNYVTTKIITSLSIDLMLNYGYDSNYLYLLCIGFHYLEYQNLRYDGVSCWWYAPIFVIYNVAMYLVVKLIFSRKVDYCE
jgi:hypothetical protein